MSFPESETAERLEWERWLLGIAGELPPLLDCHQLDKRGRCMVWREVRGWWWPWPMRITCTVRAWLGFSLRHLDRFAPSIIIGRNTIGGMP
ncbi:hypothetical protein AB0C34_16055 [Nocardia sp. NPDC049220]|uniref:hypothetical protein n=1 Tax=Nocardia sp. NPDC049220 TaxID=3155273 RepID=UPI0033C3E774